MNQEQKDKYLKHHGARCPFCEGTNLEANDKPDWDVKDYRLVVDCLDCGKRWMDVLAIVDVIELTSK